VIYLFDTNLISELRRPARADANVIAWSKQVPELSVRISTVSIHEIELGVRRLARRDAGQAAVLSRWFEEDVVARHGERIVPVDLPIARAAAALHVPDPRPQMDAFLAATALVHRWTLATRNVRDFAGTGVMLVNPWQARSEAD